ncbi:hypothetical protein M0811_01036 [Anaeramoeba ignava]|uniref:Tyrosine-protein kinase ephrin type A/B receptor-like domain-containing protein n=1 Tax=Anaeramoeba ignava TaxID=1746090 RepID=A0A9Q0LJ86_ANAIG|nr:hypothetical protein M0811_01036 [Anaeramoeba ignava]
MHFKIQFLVSFILLLLSIKISFCQVPNNLSSLIDNTLYVFTSDQRELSNFSFTGVLSNKSNITFQVTLGWNGYDDDTFMSIYGSLSIENSKDISFIGFTEKNIHFNFFGEITIDSSDNVTFFKGNFIDESSILVRNSQVNISTSNFFEPNGTNVITSFNSNFTLYDPGFANYYTLQLTSDNYNSFNTFFGLYINAVDIYCENVSLEFFCAAISQKIDLLNSNLSVLYGKDLDLSMNNSDAYFHSPTSIKTLFLTKSNLYMNQTTISDQVNFSGSGTLKVYSNMYILTSATAYIDPDITVEFYGIISMPSIPSSNLKGWIVIFGQLVPYNNLEIDRIIFSGSGSFQSPYYSLNVTDTLLFTGTDTETKTIAGNLIFSGNNITANNTIISVEKKLSLMENLMPLTSDLQSTTLIVSNGCLEIGYEVSIGRVEFYGTTILNGTSTLNVIDYLFFNSSGAKIIDSPLKALDVKNQQMLYPSTTSGNIDLRNTFEIGTHLPLVEFGNVNLSSSTSLLYFYRYSGTEQFSINSFIVNSNGTVSGNATIEISSFYILQANFTIEKISTIILNAVIYDQGNFFLKQDANLSIIGNVESDSFSMISGDGLLTNSSIRVIGDLIIESKLEFSNFTVDQQGRLYFANFEENQMKAVNLDISGLVYISNSTILDEFSGFECYSPQTEFPYPINIIDSVIQFGSGVSSSLRLFLQNSKIVSTDHIFHSINLSSTNYFENSNISLSGGKLDIENNEESKLILNSASLSMLSSSSFDFPPNSALIIQSPLNNGVLYAFCSILFPLNLLNEDSILKLMNISFEIDGSTFVNASQTIQLFDYSTLKIGSSDSFFKNLHVMNQSTVDVQNSVQIQKLNFENGSMICNSIIGSSLSSLIFGSNSGTVTINENQGETCTISTAGEVLIEGYVFVYNTTFEIDEGSSFVIEYGSSGKFESPNNDSIISNYGTFSVGDPTACSLQEKANKKPRENNLNLASLPINIEVYIENNKNGQLICYSPANFAQGITDNQGEISIFSDSIIEYLSSTNGSIFGLESRRKQLDIHNLAIFGVSKFSDLTINVSGNAYMSTSFFPINFYNITLSIEDLEMDAQSKLTLTNSTITLQNNFHFGDQIVIQKSADNDTSLFINNAQILIQSMNSVKFDLHFINNGNLFFDSSKSNLTQITDYGNLTIQNSTIFILNSSSFEKTTNLVLINNSQIEISSDNYLEFFGNASFVEKNTINGKMHVKDGSYVNLVLKSDNTSILSLSEEIQIEYKLWMELLRESNELPRYNGYMGLNLTQNQSLDLSELGSKDEQYISFTRKDQIVIAKVEGCPPGKYSSSFDSECNSCSKGTFNPYIGNYTCSECEKGTYANDTGQSECKQCPPGKYQLMKGQAECLPCDPGSYTSVNGSVHCLECKDGEFNTDYGSTSCSICPAGNYSKGGTECEPCEPGKYNAQNKASYCLFCPMGTATPNFGSLTCSSCKKNYYQDETGQKQCKQCPKNSQTDNTGSSNIYECFCSIGFFGKGGRSCAECPEGAICEDIGIEVPEAKYGYWHSADDPTTYFKCVPEQACPGGGVDSCNEELGYTGHVCADCIPGYYRFGSTCANCPNNAKNRLAIAIILVVILCLFLFIIAKKVKNYFASFSIMFSFFQIVAVISSLDLKWPSSVASTWRSLSIFNFNIDFLAIDCNFRFTFIQKWGFCMAFPFILISVLLLMYLLVFLHSKLIEKCGAGFLRKFPRFCSKPTKQTTNKFLFPFSWVKFKISQLFTHGYSKEQRKMLYNNLINSYTVILSFLYLFLSYKIMQIFACSKQSEGIYTLDADPSHLCYRSWWYSVLPWAIIFFILYVVGIPVVLFTVLILQSRKLEEKFFDLRFGLLCARYTRRWFFWEFFIMSRKLLLTIFQLFLSSDVIFPKRFLCSRSSCCAHLAKVILFSGMIFASKDLENSSSKSVLATFIIAIVWISFAVLIIMIIFEIRHRVRVKKGKDVDEIKQSLELWNGKGVLDFLASKPSFFVIFNWFIESSNHRNKLQREFFERMSNFYSDNQKKVHLNDSQFWDDFSQKWNNDFIPLFQSWFENISLAEKIQMSTIFGKIYSNVLLFKAPSRQMIEENENENENENEKK